MTAEQLYVLLTATGKPVTVQRLLKAEHRADNPLEYQALVKKLTENGKLPQ